MHTLLDLRGNIPSFITFLTASCTTSTLSTPPSRGQALLLPEAGASTSWMRLRRFRPPPWAASRRRLLRHPRKPNMNAHRVYSARRPGDGDHLRSDHRARRSLHSQHYPSTCGASGCAMPSRGKPWCSSPSVRFAGRDRLRPLQEPMAGRAVLQVDQAASADQAVLRDIRKRVKTRSGSRLGLRPRRHRQEAPQARSLALHMRQIFQVRIMNALDHERDKALLRK